MSTTAVIDRPVADTRARVAGPSIGRLTYVELRKLADTRAGMWLLIVIALSTVATVVILLTAGAPEEQRFAEFLGFAQLPTGVLLPVLGILSMTGEWTQRTALTTFALTPARSRIMIAKVLAAIVIAVLTSLICMGTSVLGNLLAIALDGDGSWTMKPLVLAQVLLLQVIFAVMGSAFGALLMNSPVAIVAFFALPMLWSALGAMIKWLADAAAWLDINVTTMVLTNPSISSGEWARIGTSVALWVALPLAVGTWRVLRREVN